MGLDQFAEHGRRAVGGGQIFMKVWRELPKPAYRRDELAFVEVATIEGASTRSGLVSIVSAGRVSHPSGDESSHFFIGPARKKRASTVPRGPLGCQILVGGPRFQGEPVLSFARLYTEKGRPFLPYLRWFLDETGVSWRHLAEQWVSSAGTRWVRKAVVNLADTNYVARAAVATTEPVHGRLLLNREELDLYRMLGELPPLFWRLEPLVEWAVEQPGATLIRLEPEP